jgi:histo-blood group ABO system transferase
MRIALCIIATKKYIDFVTPLIESAEKYFLNGHEKHYHVFSDTLGANTNIVTSHLVKHQPWPAMTLNRYKIILSAGLKGYDYVYYIDADSLFVDYVGDEILQEMVTVLHPGFYRGGGSWEDNSKSFAYVPVAYRKQYVCGGFNGGSKFLHYAKFLASNIENDRQQGITAVWHDESHLNYFYSFRFQQPALDPSYMMPQSEAKRKAWGISNFQPKIIALEKDHKTFQK